MNPANKNIDLTMRSVVMIITKYLQINSILTLNNSLGVGMLLNKLNQMNEMNNIFQHFLKSDSMLTKYREQVYFCQENIM